MGFFKFYRTVLRLAFSGKFYYAEKRAGAAALVLSTIWFFYSKPNQQWESAMTWIPIAIFFAIFIAIIIVGLVVSPYTIYEKERVRADDAEKNLLSYQSIKYVPFATAATEFMPEERHKEFSDLHSKFTSENATSEDKRKFKVASQHRVKRIRGNLEAGKLIARGKNSNNKCVEIPREFWNLAKFNFKEGTAQLSETNYTDIEIGKSYSNTKS